MTRKVLKDVCMVLLLGKRCVLKCLLRIRGIFEHTDSHYMLNKIFLGKSGIQMSSSLFVADRKDIYYFYVLIHYLSNLVTDSHFFVR